MSDKVKDGGPAFPTEEFTPYPHGGGTTSRKGGMTLRDWFAGQVLANFVMDQESLQALRHGAAPDNEWVASFCYAAADAMIAARSTET